MTVRVSVTPTASAHLDELDLWWRKERPDSATSVLDEFDRVSALLGEQPAIGVPYERKGIRNVRSVRLCGTPYNVYYHFQTGADVLTIVSVWSGMRGHGPPLKTR